VLKLAGANGMELWRQEIGAFAHVDDGATTVVLDGTGDVIASGEIDGAATVIKLAGDTGAELWRQPAPGTTLAVDAANDVIAGGYGGVAKLAGATGTLQWQTVANVFEVAVDGAGDVVAVGYGDGFLELMRVVKLSGAAGTELWRQEFAGTSADPYVSYGSAVTIDAAGDVVAVGPLDNRNTLEDWRAAKLAGDTGAVLWTRDLKGSDNFEDIPRDVALDGAGNVVIAGEMFNRGAAKQDFAVAKLDGATGVESWLQMLHGTSQEAYFTDADGATSVTVMPSGDVIAAGLLGSDFAVYRLGGLDGAIGPVGGTRLTVGDRAGDPAARRISAVAVDALIRTPPSGAGDPTVNGGSLTLRNPVTLESATFALPAGSWQALGTPAGSRGYKYTDTAGSNGPCKSLLAKPGRLRVTCLGRLGPIPFSLDEPAQGMLELSVRLGTGAAQCMRFGGDVRRDVGTGNPGPGGSFIAAHAPPFSGDCP
jgi:outer membrane protein assembly factor BamB